VIGWKLQKMQKNQKSKITILKNRNRINEKSTNRNRKSLKILKRERNFRTSKDCKIAADEG